MVNPAHHLPSPLEREAEARRGGPLDVAGTRALRAAHEPLQPPGAPAPIATATLETVAEPAALSARVDAWRRAGLRVGFVPTMGALHEGHLSLVRRAGERADRVVASVFVNPTQFGPGEDFDAYPRQEARDAELLAGAGCDLLFLPTPAALYPAGHATWVAVDGPPAIGLEAVHRPGHFRGVATVVTMLLNQVRPHVAVFGQKDAQQLALVRRLVADLHLPVEIVAGATVREADGLAMSSRNAYLGAEERRAAVVLYRALTAARAAIEAGERNADAVRERMRQLLAEEPLATVEYAEAVDAATFRPLDVLAGDIVLPLAVRIGADTPTSRQTRLIDNLPLSLG
jgi:pantoate--beta-alanine ligase